MSPLDLKRMKLELIKVGAAKAELQFKIEERLDDIRRIEDNIKIQESRENELMQKIADSEKLGE
jgi:hypothetical protein